MNRHDTPTRLMSADEYELRRALVSEGVMKQYIPPLDETPLKVVSVGDYELQRALATAIIDASPDGILVVDAHGMVVSHNRRFVEVWQIPDDRLHGTAPNSGIGASDDHLLAAASNRVKDEAAFIERVQELYHNPELSDRCEVELKDGRTLERHTTVLHNDAGAYLGRVWFFRDITQYKETEYALRSLAHFDALTGVLNRRGLVERANYELARTRRHATPLCIAMLDIDYFKQINDQHGHAAGDEVLKSLCGVSRRQLRETDILARIGGDEFALLLPDTPLDGAAALAQRLRQALGHRRLALSIGELACTVSIGVAQLEPGDASIEDCLARADGALYRAKHAGRNRVASAEYPAGQGLA